MLHQKKKRDHKHNTHTDPKRNTVLVFFLFIFKFKAKLYLALIFVIVINVFLSFLSSKNIKNKIYYPNLGYFRFSTLDRHRNKPKKII